MKPITMIEGRNIYAAARYPHPGDYYLTLVLAHWNGKYVTWYHNSQSGGFAQGEYLNPDTSLADALVEFHKRYAKVLAQYTNYQTSGIAGQDDDPKYWSTPW